jgi:PPOX class probable F420-dependent enzyme
MELQMRVIPNSHADLLGMETRALAYLATIMPDGSPQLTPLWFELDGDDILINSALGRVKDRNMRARPKVALLIVDPNDPYRYLQIRGRVVQIRQEGALEHINRLSMKYTGAAWNPVSGQTRVVYRIEPESAVGR